MLGDFWTEYILAREIDRSRFEQDRNMGLSRPSFIAFGANAARSSYYPTENISFEITKKNLLVMESGGQYLEGTTSISRTFHLGKPSIEHKKLYTYLLMGLIRLSMLVFPNDMKPAELRAIILGPLWSSEASRDNSLQFTLNGIGSYLAIEECKSILICYKSQLFLSTSAHLSM